MFHPHFAYDNGQCSVLHLPSFQNMDQPVGTLVVRCAPKYGLLTQMEATYSFYHVYERLRSPATKIGIPT
jgi:hypothetical protein